MGADQAHHEAHHERPDQDRDDPTDDPHATSPPRYGILGRHEVGTSPHSVVRCAGSTVPPDHEVAIVETPRTVPGTRLDPWVDAYAARTRGLTASQVRASWRSSVMNKVEARLGQVCPGENVVSLDRPVPSRFRLVVTRCQCVVREIALYAQCITQFLAAIS